MPRVYFRGKRRLKPLRRKSIVHRKRTVMSAPPISPSRGIRNYGNTCYLNAAMKLIKQIPQLKFPTPVFDLVYQTPEEKITEEMVWNLVRQCGFMKRFQNDAVELTMKLLMDVTNKETFEITWELQHYLKITFDDREERVPLYNGVTHGLRFTPRPDKANQLRLVDLMDRPYDNVQEMLNEVHFSAGGPGDRTVQTDFTDSDYSPDDYIKLDNDDERYCLRDLMLVVGSSKLPSCKREIYQPSCEHLIVTLDAIDFGLRRKKNNLKVTNLGSPIRFENGICYRPISVVCHLGSSISSGHYVNYTLENDTWRLFNDDRVTSLSTPGAIQGTPYMILYKQHHG